MNALEEVASHSLSIRALRDELIKINLREKDEMEFVSIINAMKEMIAKEIMPKPLNT